jgi:hypothetical protein
MLRTAATLSGGEATQMKNAATSPRVNHRSLAEAVSAENTLSSSAFEPGEGGTLKEGDSSVAEALSKAAFADPFNVEREDATIPGGTVNVDERTTGSRPERPSPSTRKGFRPAMAASVHRSGWA